MRVLIQFSMVCRSQTVDLCISTCRFQRSVSRPRRLTTLPPYTIIGRSVIDKQIIPRDESSLRFIFRSLSIGDFAKDVAHQESFVRDRTTTCLLTYLKTMKMTIFVLVGSLNKNATNESLYLKQNQLKRQFNRKSF